MTKTNSTGLRGVVFHRDKGRYEARLMERSLGRTDSPEAAARLYDAAVVATNAPYEWLNFPDEYPPQVVRTCQVCGEDRPVSEFRWQTSHDFCRTCAGCNARIRKARNARYACRKSLLRNLTTNPPQRNAMKQKTTSRRIQLPKKVNHIAYVLDASGSMDRLHSKALELVNTLIDTARVESAKAGMETRVSVFTFDSCARAVIVGADVATVRRITSADYRIAGMTALRDGVGLAIDTLRGMAGADDPNTSFLVVTITDGGENESTQYGINRIKTLMESVRTTDRWSITFQVPPGGTRATEMAFGVTPGWFGDNIREWEGTVAGIERATHTASLGTQSYFSARSAGQTKVTNFYATTDASSLNVKKIAKKLDDLSGQCRVFDVPAEEQIAPFVERKTRRAYVVGSAYYLLMKPELVQASKRVMIMEKGKLAVWGGDEAREMIGLPQGSPVQVTPGNHANFDIYVQSTSVNRKLPRGTRVLVDLQHNKNSSPTWNHLAVAKKK